MLHYCIDCTGVSQIGLKWIKRLQPQSGISLDDYRITYDPRMRYMTFRYPTTPDMRARLPIPGGYDDVPSFIYAFLPLPPGDNRSIVINRIEGHRSGYMISSVSRHSIYITIL